MAMQRSGAVAIVLTALGASLGGVLLYRDRLSPELRQYRSGLAEQTRELSGEPESVSDGAVAQRYKARRAAVEAMIADLRRLVAAESTLTVDSGYARNSIPPTLPTPSQVIVAAWGSRYARPSTTPRNPIIAAWQWRTWSTSGWRE